MQISNTNRDKVELKGNISEILALIRVTAFVLKELENEFFTRTGFNEDEARTLINTIESSIREKDDVQIIQISHQEIFVLRQSLVEVLFGIFIKDYESLFQISREGLNNIFELVNKYSETGEFKDMQTE